MINMENSVKAIKETHPETKVLVGGAPITEDFGSKIGADFYSPDPQGAVEYLKKCVA
jgi:5-methyltetrahydrofolate--homocysteine methyltransferase